MMPELERRTTVYVMRPKEYEVSGCKCGNDDPDWSEFKGHLWCPKCEIDFKPESDGIFGGPIPVNAMYLLGIDLRSYDIATCEIVNDPVVLPEAGLEFGCLAPLLDKVKP